MNCHLCNKELKYCRDNWVSCPTTVKNTGHTHFSSLLDESIYDMIIDNFYIIVNKSYESQIMSFPGFCNLCSLPSIVIDPKNISSDKIKKYLLFI